MLILTGVLVGTLMLVAAVGRIWRDQSPRMPKGDEKDASGTPG